jgi:anaerobic magnesium-protoporphyrin IX monomethyl ester cyclase
MEHRADWRGRASVDKAGSIISGDIIKSDFDPVARLQALRDVPFPETCEGREHRILHISLYCYKTFPIRTFHSMSLKDGMNSHLLCFKNNFTNRHLPISDKEVELLREVINDIDPSVVCISIMAPYVIAARQVVSEIRNVCDATVVVGGKYPTVVPHEALEFADFACKGEADLTLMRMHERIRNGENFKGLPGLWYRDEDNNVIDMGQDTLYQEMDDIPFPAIDEIQMNFIEQDTLVNVDPEIYDEDLLMMAGRGCVYLCSYCVNSLLIPMNRGNGKFVRIRSPENVLEEISYRKSKCIEPRSITFNDEIFGVLDDWVEDFSAKYKANCNLPFECELVPKLIKEKNVRLLADAGMNSLHFGVQSGQDEIRKDVMHRPGTNQELVVKSKMLREIGVTPQYDIILDNPFDTAESLSEALGLILDFSTPINLNTYKMQYFPNYPFTRMALEAGHITEEDTTDEKVANSVLYNMIYRPKFPAWDRRDYLENCIYLIPWHSRLVRSAISCLQRKHNPALGLVVTLLAMIRYKQGFEARGWLVWTRRILLGVRMIARGDIKGVFQKFKYVLAKDRHYQADTGRLSTR